MLADGGEDEGWQEYDLSVAEQLDEYWDRLQGLASGPEIDADTLRCFPFSHVKEVRERGRVSQPCFTETLLHVDPASRRPCFT